MDLVAVANMIADASGHDDDDDKRKMLLLRVPFSASNNFSRNDSALDVYRYLGFHKNKYSCLDIFNFECCN